MRWEKPLIHHNFFFHSACLLVHFEYFPKFIHYTCCCLTNSKRACPLLLAAFWPVGQRHHVAHLPHARSVVGLGIVVVKKKICTNKDDWNSTKCVWNLNQCCLIQENLGFQSFLLVFDFEGKAGVCSGFPFVVWCNLQSSSHNLTGTVNQHPPAHHPLDAPYYSVVGWTSTELIFGFTLVTISVGNRSLI
jgi:hypothetical protein